MKIYVASSSKNVVQAARVIADIHQMPQHSITYDWTKDVQKFGAGDPKLVPHDVMANAAVNDRQGVRDCELFILIWHPGMLGALIELGMAMALGKRIWIIGETEPGVKNSVQFSVFYLLPDATPEFKYGFEMMQELEHME